MLFQPTSSVRVFGEELQILLDEMWETMQTRGGIGLAANQVGLSMSMFVMIGPDNARLNLVNPTIETRSRTFANLKEGCLSAPGDFVTIPNRAEWVHVLYDDEKGNVKRVLLKGLYAVCAQHEIDHLRGVSFMENKSIPKSVRKGLCKRWGIK